MRMLQKIGGLVLGLVLLLSGAASAEAAPGAGTLTLHVDPTTYLANNYSLGSNAVYLAKYKFSAKAEDVNIRTLKMHFNISSKTPNLVRQIRLVDETNTTVGQTILWLQPWNTSYFPAEFQGLNYTVKAGTSRTVSVVADFATYQDLFLSSSAHVITPVVLSLANSNGVEPVYAIGASSGITLSTTVANTTVVGAQAAPTTFYRTKLMAYWSASTPQGFSNPNPQQIVARLIVANENNAGQYEARVRHMTVELASTIKPATTERRLSVYSGTPGAQNRVATRVFPAGSTFTGKVVFSDKEFADVTIAAGGSKEFTVVLDTLDAESGKAISVRIPSGGIAWYDGSHAGLTGIGGSLPLSYRTLAY